MSEKDILVNWQHSLNAIEETLDHELIEGRGKQLLFKALKNENLVAFVGTGISAAYGRMSWSQLLEKQIGDVEDKARKFIQFSHCAIEKIEAMHFNIDKVTIGKKQSQDKKTKRIIKNHLKIKNDQIRYRLADIEPLFETFLGLRNTGNVLGGEIYPIQFQIAKKLSDTLQMSENLFLYRQSTIDARRREVMRVTEQDKARIQCRFGYKCEFRRKRKHNKFAFGEHLKIIEEYCVDIGYTFRDFDEAFGKYYRAICKRGSELRFIDYTKHLVYDENAHAEYIITNGIGYREKFGRPRLRDALIVDETDKGLAKAEKQARRTRLRNYKIIERQFPKLIPEELTRNLPSIRNRPERFKALGYFKNKTTRNIANFLNQEITSGESSGESKRSRISPKSNDVWKRINKIILWKIDLNNKTERNRSIISPVRRFLVGMLLAKIKDPLVHKKTWKGSKDCFFDQVSKTDFRGRSTLIDKNFDPLQSLSLDLGIRQFLTTNYDLEIERLFQDRGYLTEPPNAVSRNAPDFERHRSDSLGGVATDSTFERKNAADLFAFSTDREGADANVFHLHGRATIDSSIVLTERDYMDLYLRNDEDRDLVNESIELAFSANPILFVGIGMNESDVLRPLRQFISDQERRRDRTSIALLPATQRPEDVIRESSTLYTRYGVHAIYFGHAWLDVSNLLIPKDSAGHARRKELPNFHRFNWLNIANNLIKLLKSKNDQLWSTLEALRKIVESNKSDSEIFDVDELVSHLKKIQKLYPHTSDASAHTEILKDIRNSLGVSKIEIYSLSNLDILFGRPFDFQGRNLNSKFSSPEFETDDKSRCVVTELDLELKLLVHLLDLVALRDIRIFHVDIKKKRRLKNLLENKRFQNVIDELLRDCHAVDVGLDGIRSSIMSACLCAKLKSIHTELSKWWTEWRQKPEERRPFFQTQVSDDSNSHTILDQAKPRYLHFPVIYIRHDIDNAITKFPDKLDCGELSERNVGALNSGYARDVARHTGVRAFDTFLDSILSINRAGTYQFPEFHNPKLRRIFLVAAHRGLGKGIFLSAFSHQSGLAGFIDCSWRHNSNQAVPIYVSAMFVNYSFSTEVSSSWDMIKNALAESIAEILNNKNNPLELRKLDTQNINSRKLETKTKEVLKEFSNLPRTKILKKLLDRFSELVSNQNNSKFNFRILVCFGAIDLLYSGGNPKNREIAEIFDVITGDNAKNIPLDIVYICEEANVPTVLQTPDAGGLGLGGDDGRFALLAQEDSKLSFAAANAILERARKTKIPFAVHPQQSKFQGDNITVSNGNGNNKFLHLCHHLIPEEFLIDNYLPLATIFCIGFIYDQLASSNDENSKKLKDFSIRRFRDLGCSETLEEIRKLVFDNHIMAFLRMREISGNNLKEVLFERYEAENSDTFSNSSHQEWLEIRTRLRSNRFSLTLILAAAQRIALTQKTILEGRSKAEAFIRSVIDHVSAVGEERREEIIVHDVLDVYEDFHVAGDPENDIDLHLSILRHLAVMCQPCSADVLVRTPEIRLYFDQNAEDREKAQQEGINSRTASLNEALNALEKAGLLFRLRPYPRLVALYEQGEEELDQIPGACTERLLISIDTFCTDSYNAT